MKLPGLKVAEKVKKLSEKTEGEAPADEAKEKFRSRAALTISVLAGLLALASAGADKSAQTIINSNIQASDSWAFYQAKNVRQLVNVTAAEALDSQLAIHGASIAADAKAAMQAAADKRRETASRYDDEPDPKDADNPIAGDGKKQLKARAQHWEGLRDKARRQRVSFSFSAILLQIGIVLGSTAILSNSRRMLAGTFVIAVFGALMLLNGYTLLVPLGG